MNLERFERLLALYGGDLRDWPEADRRRAEVLMERSAEAGRLLERAACVDQSLRASKSMISSEVIERLLNRLESIPSQSSPSGIDSIGAVMAMGLPGAFRRPWVAAALMGTMMTIGILLGAFAVPTETHRALDFTAVLAERSFAGFDL
jgi:hypothetical protein